MGARGPVPNRSEDLARPRERKGSEQQSVTKGELKPVEIPEPDADWHPIARMLWDSLALSGQSDFYQQSDWAFAYSLCDDLSFYKSPTLDSDGNPYLFQKRSGQMLQTIYSAMERLLVSEGDRRRVRIELTSPHVEESTEGDAAIADYEQGLRLVPPLPEGDA